LEEDVSRADPDPSGVNGETLVACQGAVRTFWKDCREDAGGGVVLGTGASTEATWHGDRSHRV